MVMILDLSAAFATVSHTHPPEQIRPFRNSGNSSFLAKFLLGRVRTAGLSPPFLFIPPNLWSVGCIRALPRACCFLISIWPPLATLIETWGVNVVSYTDETQLQFSFQDHSEAVFLKFKECLNGVAKQMESHFLKRNMDKTEIAFFSQNASLHHPANFWWPEELNLPPSPTSSAKNLVILFDSNLSLTTKIRQISSICFLKLRSVRMLLHLVPEETSNIVVHALVT